MKLSNQIGVQFVTLSRTTDEEGLMYIIQGRGKTGTFEHRSDTFPEPKKGVSYRVWAATLYGFTLVADWSTP